MRPIIRTVGLVSLIVFGMMLLPSQAQAASAFEWALVNNNGQVLQASRRGISVEIRQPGEYIVTFPRDIKVRAATATVSSSGGEIVATPPTINNTLAPNQVSVLTLSSFGAFEGGTLFTVVVYY